MLESLSIQNYKSFINQDIQFGNLTLLTGLNSSGKSSVIQALRILEKYVNNKCDHLIDGHGSWDELHCKSTKEPIQIGASLKSNGVRDRIIFTPGIKGELDLKYPKIIYISASRFGPQKSIPISHNNFLGENGENLLNVIDFYQDYILPEPLQHPESIGETFLFNLKAWLSEISPGVKFDYKLQKITDSSFTSFNEHRAANVGFGLSYILPVLTALLVGAVEENVLVIIENPEAHLHPKGQTEIARLVSLVASTGTQVIVETHSDHFFDGVRIFAKNNPEFAKDITIHWFENDNRGISKVESPLLTSNGRLSYWPKGLFDQFEINADQLL